MAAPPKGPFTKAQDPNVCIGEDKACGLCANCTQPQIDPRVIMDYPTAWEFVRNTNPQNHHEKCSWRTENGALLCDCDILWDEYERRGGERPK